MKLAGLYHSDSPMDILASMDTPTIVKGRMALSAHGIASSGELLGIALGRIRNRRQLISKLHVAQTITDSDLILEAYREWGISYPSYVEGPVITALFDSYSDILVISRDRMGELPLFYCLGSIIAFSDHPDVLIDIGVVAPVVDRTGLLELLALGPARSPGRTPYRDMLSLDAGCSLVVLNGHGEVKRYFDLSVQTHTDDINSTIERTRQLIDQAIDDIAWMRPAAMLSGGIDSTALTALLAKKIGKIDSFSVDYEGNETDFVASKFIPERDAPYIRMAARVINTRHTRVRLSQRMLASALADAVDIRGFPGMADIDTSMLLFARKISPHAQNIISGECGDEVFCGYPWFRNYEHNTRFFPWSNSLDFRQKIIKPGMYSILPLTDYASSTFASAIKSAPCDDSDSAEDSILKRIQYVCFKFFMPNLQERVYRMLDSNGINVLTPFCDDRLVQYVFNVPSSIKYLDGREKGLLRRAVADLLPEKLLYRKKCPYPKTCSPSYADIARRLTLVMLDDKASPVSEIINGDFLRQIALSPLAPDDAPWYGQLMAGPQMLMYIWQLNYWFKRKNITLKL